MQSGMKYAAAMCLSLSTIVLYGVSVRAENATFKSTECDNIVAMFTNEILPKAKTGIEPYRDFAESVVKFGSLDCPTSYAFFVHTPESIEVFTAVKTQLLEAKLDASNLLATDKAPPAAQ